MIFFEIDGTEYAARISTVEAPDAIPFTSPEGVTYWMHKPMAAE